MKKLLAVLLALMVVGGFAFAQGKVAIGLDGKVTLIDQDLVGSTAYYNNTYVSGLSFSGTDADATKGVSISMLGAPVHGNALLVANYKGWWTFADKMLKLSIGDFSMSDYRTYALYTGAANSKLGGGQVEQVLLQAYPVAGLSIGLQVPYSTTAVNAGDLWTTPGIGMSYAIADVGTLKANANISYPTDTYVFAAGFDYTGVETLEVVAVYQGTYTTALSNWFNLSANYNLDKLALYAEFDGSYDTAFAFTAYLSAGYTINDNLSASLDASMDDASVIDVSGTGTYAFGNGVSLNGTVGYNTDSGLYWSVPLKFTVNF